MFTNNTVIVLGTKGKGGNGTEYRVACVQATKAENMTRRADHPPDNPRLNRRWTLVAFRKAPRFTESRDAMREAVRVKEEIEKGGGNARVVITNLSTIFFPASDPQARAA